MPPLDPDRPAETAPRDYRHVWEASPLAFLVLGQDGRVAAVSPAGARIFAATQPFLAGRPFLDLVDPMDQAAADDMLRRALRGESPPRQEIRFCRPNGEAVVGGLSIARILESDAPEALAVIRDLSHEHTLRPNLLQTEKLATMGAVAATVAHEVNNPLMGASSALQTLRLMLGLTEQLELVDTALGEIDRAARIVQSLRQFAHKGDDPKQHILVEELLQSVARLHAVTHGAEIPVDVECAADTPAVDGVRNQLIQALRNLMRNAHQAMADGASEHKRIALRARRRGADALTIEVSDRGPGVPAALRERIFDAFYSTKAASDGTGLGLTVVQAVAGSHGGRIDVLDTPGGGATFALVLPAAKAAPQPTSKKSAAGAVSLPDGLRLLIVDDEQAIRFAVGRYCRRINDSVQIAEAHDADSAILALEQADHDVVLLDRHFPGGGNTAVLAAMARLRPGLMARTILMSGALEEDSNDEIGQGYAASLQKPFDLKSLAQLDSKLAAWRADRDGAQ